MRVDDSTTDQIEADFVDDRVLTSLDADLGSSGLTISVPMQDAGAEPGSPPLLQYSAGNQIIADRVGFTPSQNEADFPLTVI